MQKDTETLLLKGNEAIAHAAIRYGYDGFFGYPITPQSEILETLALLRPWETTGMVVLQSESEVASINMIYAGGASGKYVLTSSSSVGISLMQEVIPYMAICEVPALLYQYNVEGQVLAPSNLHNQTIPKPFTGEAMEIITT